MKLLDGYRCFSIDLNGSVPAGIGNLIESFKISINPLFRSVKVFLLILIVFRDAGEVKGKVSFLYGLLPSIQNLIDFFFFGNLAGQKEENREQKREEVFSHFRISASLPG